jgi:hypothetical protein
MKLENKKLEKIVEIRIEWGLETRKDNIDTEKLEKLIKSKLDNISKNKNFNLDYESGYVYGYQEYFQGTHFFVPKSTLFYDDIEFRNSKKKNISKQGKLYQNSINHIEEIITKSIAIIFGKEVRNRVYQLKMDEDKFNEMGFSLTDERWCIDYADGNEPEWMD